MNPLIIAAALIGGTSLLGSLFGGKGSGAGEAFTNLKKTIRDETDVSAILGRFQQLFPQYRSILAASGGNQISNALASNLSKRGLLTTGIGTSLLGSSAGAFDALVLQKAIEDALHITDTRVGGIVGAAGGNVGNRAGQSSGLSAASGIGNLAGLLLALGSGQKSQPQGIPLTGSTQTAIQPFQDNLFPGNF